MPKYSAKISLRILSEIYNHEERHKLKGSCRSNNSLNKIMWRGTWEPIKYKGEGIKGGNHASILLMEIVFCGIK